MTMLVLVINALAVHAAEMPGQGFVPKTWTTPMVCEALVTKGLDARRPLDEAFDKAQAQLASVKAAAGRVAFVERRYFAQIARAAEAALGKHHREFLEEPDLRKMDIPHHMEILRAIAAFDPKRARSSLVKINEALSLRHDRDEYIECIED